MSVLLATGHVCGKPELLEIEVDLRQKRGETLRADEYHQRFPNHPHLIDAVLGKAARPKRLGNYQLLEELGQGSLDADKKRGAGLPRGTDHVQQHVIVLGVQDSAEPARGSATRPKAASPPVIDREELATEHSFGS